MRRGLVLFPLALLLAASAGLHGLAYQPLRVDPSRFILQGKPGDQLTGAIMVVNKGAEQTNPKAALSDWTQNPVDGVVKLDGGKLPSTLSGWIKFNPRQFALAPGKTQIVRFTVRIPRDARPGERHGMILFEQVEPPVPGENSAEIRVQLATTIYVAVLPVQRTCAVAGVQVTPQPAEGLTRVSADIKGTGTAHFRGHGTFEIKPAGGLQVVARGALEPVVVVPEATARFSGAFKGSLPTGKYEITLTIKSEEPKAKPVVFAQDYVQE